LSIIGIVAATAAGMILGALWYSPLLFGRAWMESIGKTEEELGSARGPMIGSVLACLLTALALGFLLSAAGVRSPGDGALLGLVVGLGIVFPALLSDNLFCGWGRRLLLIQSGYRVLYIVVMSVILTALA